MFIIGLPCCSITKSVTALGILGFALFCLSLLKYLLTVQFPQALYRYVFRPARRLMT